MIHHESQLCDASTLFFQILLVGILISRDQGRTWIDIDNTQAISIIWQKFVREECAKKQFQLRF